MLFDSHIHTKFSADSEMTATEVLSRAGSLNLGVVFTEQTALPELIHLLRDWGYKFGVVTPMTPQPW